ncbi:hypothetical protein PRUPE_6G146100 [Prunus persica]|uniref:Uncharacterized protein n=1 Tax=Prunus persica TaxID=3760 RepID=A0A251NQG8_PRUPE|nr:hypothetical protein PRUPE_6G146100 [Prunus persica]
MCIKLYDQPPLDSTERTSCTSLPCSSGDFDLMLEYPPLALPKYFFLTPRILPILFISHIFQLTILLSVTLLIRVLLYP